MEEKWNTVENKLAFYWGKNIKELIVKTRFDGFGNAVVRFIVINGEKETSYEKYNSALEAYKLIPEI